MKENYNFDILTEAASEADKNVSERDHKTNTQPERKERLIQQSIKLFEKFVDKDSPYLWELPEKRLLDGDENYDLYMCRNNVLSPIQG